MIKQLLSYAKYDETADRDYMVYAVQYVNGFEEYVSREVFRNLKTLDILTRFDLKPSHVTKYNTYEEFMENGYLSCKNETIEMFFANGKKAPSRKEFELIKEALS